MTRTYAEIDRAIRELGYKLIDEYINRKRKKSIRMVKIIDKYGYKYDVMFSHVINKRGINFVDASNPYTLENICLWLIRNKKSFKIRKNNKYINAHMKLSFHCNECHENFDATWGRIYQDRGCPYCSGKKVGRHNNLAYLRPDLMREWDKNNNKINPRHVTLKSHKIALWICKKCKNKWHTLISSRTSKNSGCPKCRASHGEKIISSFLLEKRIKFIKQKRFDNCKYQKQLPFDFYLPEYNVCIEYQGQQHYKILNNNYWGGKDNLKGIQKRDRIKKKYCEKNNIKLICISYKKINLIDKILNKKLELQ